MIQLDIRVLRYFLTVAREGSFSRAAKSLFLSQPTLSRQIRDMEQQLGVTLFNRTNRNVTLTKDGMRLFQRAEEIVSLMDKTQNEFVDLPGDLRGDIHIGCGETHQMRQLARIAIDIRRENPGIRYHIYSGNSMDVSERLDKGMLDFGLMVDSTDAQKYDMLRLPGSDTWGVLMRQDDPLSRLSSITPDDLIGTPLLLSRQAMVASSLTQWMGRSLDQFDVVASYNLIFNAAIMVEQGLGVALGIDHLVDTMAVQGLCFRPLEPKMTLDMHLVWKKHQEFSPAAELFLQRARQAFEGK